MRIKKGFTLQEVLITLGIVGVIAALILPSVSQNTREKSLTAQKENVKNTLENVFTTMQAQSGEKDFSIEDYSNEDLLEYMKFTDDGKKLTLKSGAQIKIIWEKGTVIVDANGDKKPNKCNEDRIIYSTYTDGKLSPMACKDDDFEDW